MNSDGLVVNGQAATGGILRGEDGRMIKAFAMNLGETSITRAELEGIVQGMRLAWEQGYRKVMVQTDSQIAIYLIREAADRHPHFLLVQEARRLLACDWQVQLIHVFREGNVVVDYLALVGHSLPFGFHFIEGHYPLLNYWLFFYLIGVETPCLVNI
ncbi:unnamed protein product [Linum tenue]|uniref:RNase H type-1 domain-containing protein n=1 Tax=Linum tenue TaxID=586396 RepID=A0AAV0RNT7_9ROSI|nr:unnamed protein product [Linum tenue]